MSLLRAINTSNDAADALTAADEPQALSDALYLVSETDSMLLDGTTEELTRMISERATILRTAIHRKPT